MNNQLIRLKNILNDVTGRYDYIISGSTAIYLICEAFAPHLTPNIEFPNNIELWVDHDFKKSLKGTGS